MPKPAAAPKELSFPFDEEEWDKRSLKDAKVPEDQYSLDIGTPLAEGQRAARPSRSAPLIPLSEEYNDEEESFEDERDEARSENQDADEAEDKGGTRIMPVFLFVYCVVIPAYFLFSGALYRNPVWADQIARKLPFIGSLNRDRLLTRKVILADVQGAYERIKEGREIFMVRGEVTNHASVPLSSIQVLVKVFDAQGRLMADRAVFCGGDVPKKLLRDMSQVEASIIGQLKPPRTYVVQPGDRSPFVVVFSDLPASVGDFSTQVYVAQRQV